jgi:hypothetical protein
MKSKLVMKKEEEGKSARNHSLFKGVMKELKRIKETAQKIRT